MAHKMSMLLDHKQKALTSVDPSITSEKGPRISMVTTLIAIETNRTYYQWAVSSNITCSSVGDRWWSYQGCFYMLLFFSEEN
ncbi:unnamed protein product [Sphenostylis stenocarpa]|uniref:Uncharacterized protein n=1 Tax=Sphenostylis stenocarpa TaxID=92480 RepID=A0AA86SNH6_9FABA|nr:unnamed protein product [Sphenostylis stenocarpa]